MVNIKNTKALFVLILSTSIVSTTNWFYLTGTFTVINAVEFPLLSMNGQEIASNILVDDDFSRNQRIGTLHHISSIDVIESSHDIQIRFEPNETHRMFGPFPMCATVSIVSLQFLVFNAFTVSTGSCTITPIPSLTRTPEAENEDISEFVFDDIDSAKRGLVYYEESVDTVVMGDIFDFDINSKDGMEGISYDLYPPVLIRHCMHFGKF